MVFKRVKEFLNYWYLQYALCTSLYMLEPMERKILNSILVATIAMGVYTTYLFFPGHAVVIIHYMEYFFGSDRGGHRVPSPVDTQRVTAP